MKAILTTAILLSMLFCSAEAIDLSNDFRLSPEVTSLNPDWMDPLSGPGDGIPFVNAFSMADWPNHPLMESGADEAALLLYSEHRWDWWVTVDEMFGGAENVPPEWQGWLDPDPHVVDFVISDATGEQVHGNVTIDFTDGERQAVFNPPRPSQPPFPEPYEIWHDEVDFNNGRGHRFFGESFVILPLDAATVADINAELLQPDGMWTITIDAPGQSVWTATVGIAPGRPQTVGFGGILVLSPAVIPEPPTWVLVALVLAIGFVGPTAFKYLRLR